MKENTRTLTLDPSYWDLGNWIETQDNTSPSYQIEEVTITPEPWQYDILKWGNKDIRQRIYEDLTFYKDNSEKDKYHDIWAKMQDDFISKYRETYYGKSPDEDGSKWIKAYHNASDALSDKIREIPDKVIDYSAQHAALKRLHEMMGRCW